VREGYKAESLALSHRLRGLLAEFGIVMGKSDKALRRVLADLDAYTALPAEFKALIRSVDAHWTQVRTAFDACDARIEAHARDDARCVRLRAIVGVGALTANALIASLGKAQEFRNGRQLAAWRGMVPTQHSSGGHTRLGAISCRGDGYLRTLLIQGARSSLQRAKAVAMEKATPEQLWIRSLAARLSFGKVLVAIANKHARQLWVMLAHEVDYDPCASQRHPMHRPTQLARGTLAFDSPSAPRGNNGSDPEVSPRIFSLNQHVACRLREQCTHDAVIPHGLRSQRRPHHAWHRSIAKVFGRRTRFDARGAQSCVAARRRSGDSRQAPDPDRSGALVARRGTHSRPAQGTGWFIG
jgi:hypothetical protein